MSHRNPRTTECHESPSNPYLSDKVKADEGEGPPELLGDGLLATTLPALVSPATGTQTSWANEPGIHPGPEFWPRRRVVGTGVCCCY